MTKYTVVKVDTWQEAEDFFNILIAFDRTNNVYNGKVYYLNHEWCGEYKWNGEGYTVIF